MGGAVAVLGPVGQVGSFDCFPGSGAFDGGGVDHDDVVGGDAEFSGEGFQIGVYENLHGSKMGCNSDVGDPRSRSTATTPGTPGPTRLAVPNGIGPRIHTFLPPTRATR